MHICCQNVFACKCRKSDLRTFVTHLSLKNDLRALSGKFLHAKVCHLESFDFLGLWLQHKRGMVKRFPKLSEGLLTELKLTEINSKGKIKAMAGKVEEHQL